MDNGHPINHQHNFMLVFFLLTIFFLSILLCGFLASRVYIGKLCINKEAGLYMHVYTHRAGGASGEDLSKIFLLMVVWRMDKEV